MEPILKVADLSKAFSRAGRDAFFAVDHVSFEVQPGEILGIAVSYTHLTLPTTERV